MKLFGSDQSGHSYKVRLFLTLAQIEHEYIWVDLMLARKDRPADFMAASKHGEVPVLVDDELTICQSNAILQHLADKTGLYGGNHQVNAHHQVNEWLSWEANRVGFSLPNYRFARIWQKPPQDIMDYLLGRLLFDLKILNKHLVGKDYLVGDSLTIADLSNSAYMFWLDDVGIDVNEYPNVKDWLDKITALPHYQPPTTLMAKP